MNSIRQCCLFAFLVATGPLYPQPKLERMEPRGTTAGTSAKLVLTGQRLGLSPRLISEAPFAATPLVPPFPRNQVSIDRLEYLVEVSGDARPGIYPIRIETPEGLSNIVLFTVGAFPQVTETESLAPLDTEIARNDAAETAEVIAPPIVVEGRLQGPERDMFRVSAMTGQRLVAEVAARRIGSAIDPILEILDRYGTVLARSSDAPGLELDSRLVFEAKTGGDYYIALRDERFSSQANNFYRLTVADFEFADRVFPPGWTRNAKVHARFSGGNLARPLDMEIDLRSIHSTTSEIWLPVPGSPSTVPFLLSDGAETVESAAGGNLTDGIVINGRIESPGEIDEYHLSVRSGEEWAFELRSGESVSSLLYGVMTVSSGEKILAVAGRQGADPGPYVTASTGVTATSPYIHLTVPADVSELTVSVEDLLERGGPGYTYRLLASERGSDFLLTLNEPYVNIPRNGSAVVTVTAERRGYSGPIQLYAETVPAGVVVSGGHIAATSTLGSARPRFSTGSLTLTAEAGAESRLLDLTIRGRATGNGRADLDRRAPGPGLSVAVEGAKQRPVTAEWLGYTLPARITPEQPGSLAFLTPHHLRLVRGGRGLVAKWRYTARQPGVRITKPVEIPRNTGSIRLRRLDDNMSGESGEFLIFAHERTSPGMVNFHLSSTVSSGGRDWPLISRPLEIEVVDGYGLRAADSPFTIVRGSEATWRGSIWRDPEFRRPVTVAVLGLPRPVECSESELAGSDTEFEILCTAGADAPIGGHEIEIRAESLLSDEGTTKYVADPVKAWMSVGR